MLLILKKGLPISASPSSWWTPPAQYDAHGDMKVWSGVVSHKLLSDGDMLFLSLILSDGRRILLSVAGRDFEFSAELSHILEQETTR